MSVLCLDIGNSHIFGGLYREGELAFQFRYPTIHTTTADQFGVFLRAIIQENGEEYREIQNISIASVVPSLNYSVNHACMKYLDITPFFLTYGSQRKIIANFPGKEDIGADRLAADIAALSAFPEEDLIVIDMGTATTFDVLHRKGEFLGGLIIPGMKTSIQSLANNTAKLPEVEIIKPAELVSTTTKGNIQSGIYYSHLGAMREIIQEIRTKETRIKNAKIVACGGFSYLYENENLFDHIQPDLVLQGLRQIVSTA